MIKDILILLWILIIPLVITVRRLFQTYTTILPQKKLTLPKEKKSELIEIIIRICTPILVVPLCFITEGPSYFSQSYMLRGILAGEIIVVDLVMGIYYLKLGRDIIKKIDIVKKFYMFLFIIINFWTSALWAIQGDLSLTVLWISVIAYLVFGLEYIMSFCFENYFEKGKSS